MYILEIRSADIMTFIAFSVDQILGDVFTRSEGRCLAESWRSSELWTPLSEREGRETDYRFSASRLMQTCFQNSSSSSLAVRLFSYC